MEDEEEADGTEDWDDIETEWTWTGLATIGLFVPTGPSTSAANLSTWRATSLVINVSANCFLPGNSRFGDVNSEANDNKYRGK